MACPRCGKSHSQPTPSCPSCGFSLEVLSTILGSDMVKLDRLTDKAHCLRLREAQALESALDGFERRFPQVFVGVYLGVLPPAFKLNELTFWLLNHAAFNVPDYRKLNEFAVVVIIDPVARTAALNVGYALDRWLPQDRLAAILRSMRTRLWHGEYVDAVMTALAGIEKSLKRGAKKVLKQDDIVPPSPGSELANGLGLRTLRRQAALKPADEAAQKTALPKEDF